MLGGIWQFSLRGALTALFFQNFTNYRVTINSVACSVDCHALGCCLVAHLKFTAKFQRSLS